MAKNLQRLISTCHQIDPSLQLHTSVNWSARQPGHRRRLRAAANRALDLSENIEDLNKIPRPKTYSLSLSHTLGMGGWASVCRPTRVGFDIESLKRISLSVVQRIASRSELEECPQGFLLWSAKESFFKALEHTQPQVLSEVRVGHWRDLRHGLYSFRGLQPTTATGIIYKTRLYLYSVCLIK